jgi:PhzF family phenazine biosynthesis protein
MRAFAQIDVFTTQAGFGNPVAVVLDAEGLGDDAMQRFANWANLSETTFVLPATTAVADYRLRIFTPDHELPFAGHPTIGTARALLDADRLPDRPSWVQECGAGLVELRRSDDGVISFAAPAAKITPSPISASDLGAVLGSPPPGQALLVEVGPRWITGRLDLASLSALRPDATAFLNAFDRRFTDGVNVYAVDAAQVHVRSFFAASDMLVEDPVCGSGNAAVAAHLTHTGTADDVPRVYEARQGAYRGRDGRITVTLGDPIWVGGPAVTVVTGTVTI